MNTYMAKAQEIERKWYVVDADGMVLGRLASQVANILRGKHKPIYTPHVDTGDHVIIINASKVVLTGKKLDQKYYYHHSGFPGGYFMQYVPIMRIGMCQFLLQQIKQDVSGMTSKNLV